MTNLSPEERGKARQDWAEKCRLAREEIKVNPIDYYATLIRGRRPWFELSYEDNEARMVESTNHDLHLLESSSREDWLLREKPSDYRAMEEGEEENQIC